MTIKPLKMPKNDLSKMLKKLDEEVVRVSTVPASFKMEETKQKTAHEKELEMIRIPYWKAEELGII